MEYFYCYMCKKYDLFMVNENDFEGGKWNYDFSNRKKWKGFFEILYERGFRKDVVKIVKCIKDFGVEIIGYIDLGFFNWFIF